VRLPEIANHPYFQQVPINRDIDVALAAKLASMSVDDFKALNPSAHRLVILAAGTPQVLLPWDNARLFQQNLNAYGTGRLASWTAWVAPTTMKAAEAAHRVGMSEADLRNINKVPPRMLVKAGSTLLVPRSERKVEDVSVKVADNAQLSLAPETVLRKTTVKAKRGDTVAALAARYKVTVSDIVAWNKISSSAHLYAGQALILHLSVKAASAQRATKTTARSKVHR
jgi:membrane-bound lytic murein transglycosylase D